MTFWQVTDASVFSSVKYIKHSFLQNYYKDLMIELNDVTIT